MSLTISRSDRATLTRNELAVELFVDDIACDKWTRGTEVKRKSERQAERKEKKTKRFGVNDDDDDVY
jgi:hypothetical protein